MCASRTVVTSRYSRGPFTRRTKNLSKAHTQTPRATFLATRGRRSDLSEKSLYTSQRLCPSSRPSSTTRPGLTPWCAPSQRTLKFTGRRSRARKESKDDGDQDFTQAAD